MQDALHSCHLDLCAMCSVAAVLQLVAAFQIPSQVAVAAPALQVATQQPTSAPKMDRTPAAHATAMAQHPRLWAVGIATA